MDWDITYYLAAAFPKAPSVKTTREWDCESGANESLMDYPSTPAEGTDGTESRTNAEKNSMGGSRNRENNQIAIQSIEQRGIKRFVRQIFALSGKIIRKNGEIERLILNPFYPMVDRMKIALEVLLQPYEITVSLGKT